MFAKTAQQKKQPTTGSWRMDETCIKLKRKCTCPRFPNGEERVNEGQSVKVKLVGFDDRGKVRLSMKVVDQETGEEITKEG